MTKTVYVTDLSEVKHIIVSCGKCGFAVILPLHGGYKKTVGCVKCDVAFPADEIKTWIEVTENLQKTLAEVTSDARIEIETEETK